MSPPRPSDLNASCTLYMVPNLAAGARLLFHKSDEFYVFLEGKGHLTVQFVPWLFCGASMLCTKNPVLRLVQLQYYDNGGRYCEGGNSGSSDGPEIVKYKITIHNE